MAILKVKDGSKWVDIPSIVGPQGESGSPGPEGSPGISPDISVIDISGGHRVSITDANGLHSFDILNGVDGQDGQTGPTGKDGADGTTFTPAVSAEGVISWTNNGGKMNPQPMNIKGPQGIQGEQGIQGPKGDKGDKGDTGEQGIQGTKGDTGATGATGPAGPKGDKGDTGAQGPQGETGATGATGPQGPKGDTGATGPKGDPGDDYILTAADKSEIAQQAAAEVDVPVQDVQVNGTSVLDAQGVANVLIVQYVNLGTETDYPLSKESNAYPLGVTLMRTLSATEYPYAYGTVVTIRAANARCVQFSFGNSPNSYKLRTADSNGWSDWHIMGDSVVTVSGTTPAINAQAGVRYVCGEVATISITPPASGCIDVVFQSGSTPTVLTITPPTGVTIKWANGFDPTSLEANATYELNIMNGLGVAVSWT